MSEGAGYYADYNSNWVANAGKKNNEINSYNCSQNIVNISDNVAPLSYKYERFLPTTTSSNVLELDISCLMGVDWGVQLIQEQTGFGQTTSELQLDSSNDYDLVVYGFGDTYTDVALGMVNPNWDTSATSQSYSITAKEHILGSPVVVDATCLNVGSTTYSCTDPQCDYQITSILPIDPNNHNAGAAATCTTAQTCTLCGAILTEALGHDWSSSWTTTSSPTCTTAGTEVIRCKRCNVLLDSRSIPALGHDWPSSWTTTTSPTCTTAGTEVKRCERCNELLSSRSIPATGHTPGTPATCTTAQTCTTCGAVITPALGHSWSQEVRYETLNAYTCPYKVVEKDFRCDDCGIWQGNPTYSNVYVGHVAGSAATCTTAQTCTRCNDVLVAALGHNAGSWTFDHSYWDEDQFRYIDVYYKRCTRCNYIMGEYEE